MYVLCTLAVLTLHSLFKSRNKAVEPDRTSEAAEQKAPLQDGGDAELCKVPRTLGQGDDAMKIVDNRGQRSCRAEGKRKRGGGMRNVPVNRTQVQVRRRG